MTDRDAETLARGLLGDLERRWTHVRGVAACAERLRMSRTVIDAAWLHDIGYSPEVKDSGMHAIDGAAYLQEHGWPSAIVGLVAHHTGAWSEAEERGLTNALDQCPEPSDADLDALTLCDLLVGPSGEQVEPEKRLEEILERYSHDHPVHRAVARSQNDLIARAKRAWSRVSADVRGVSPF